MPALMRTEKSFRKKKTSFALQSSVYKERKKEKGTNRNRHPLLLFLFLFFFFFWWNWIKNKEKKQLHDAQCVQVRLEPPASQLWRLPSPLHTHTQHKLLFIARIRCDEEKKTADGGVYWGSKRSQRERREQKKIEPPPKKKERTPLELLPVGLFFF